MKVLVTGATGFVGGWLVKRLLEQGHSVRILQRKNYGVLPETSGPEVVVGDVTSYESLIAAFQGVHSVFHLAGHVGYSRADRALMEQVNVKGTENVLQACKAAKIKRLVHMSSVVAVGASFNGKNPLNEDSVFNLHHLDLGYFETKLKAEKRVMEFTKNGVVDAVIVNPSTIYGAGDAKKGSRKTQLKVAQGRFPFYTSGGVSIVGVEDVVQATLAAWQKGRTGERYILSGENITIRRLFEIIAKHAGVSEPWIYLPNFVVKTLGVVGDTLESNGKKGPLNSENAWASILYHWFDHGKARRELGFKPQNADEVIGKSVAWIKENGYLESK